MRRYKFTLIILMLVIFVALIVRRPWRWLQREPASVAQTRDGFETKRVSTNTSDLPQGETEIVADGVGHVVIAWMDGSPVNQAKMTLRTVYSEDGGKTFVKDQKVAENLIMGDPTLSIDQQGNIYLGALRKDSQLGYSDLAVVFFRSRDFGNTWDPLVDVNDDDVFNDRPWMTADAEGQLHVVFCRRVPRPDGNYDCPVYYRRVGHGSALSQLVLVNPPSSDQSFSAGGSPRGVAVTKDGRVLIGYQHIPRDNASRLGAGTFRAPASVMVSHDGGRNFGRPIPFTTLTTLVADQGDEASLVADQGDEASAEDTSPKTFARIKTFQNHVYAVWIGEARGNTHSVYVAVLPEGKSWFDPPVAVVSGALDTLTLATLAIDPWGTVHVFWLGQRADGLWSLFYSSSADGTEFAVPRNIADIAFPMEQWPGDFISATANGTDVFVAWAVAGGPRAGIYVSIARRLDDR
jgi:hypothetical protein